MFSILKASQLSALALLAFPITAAASNVNPRFGVIPIPAVFRRQDGRGVVGGLVIGLDESCPTGSTKCDNTGLTNTRAICCPTGSTSCFRKTVGGSTWPYCCLDGVDCATVLVTERVCGDPDWVPCFTDDQYKCCDSTEVCTFDYGAGCYDELPTSLTAGLTAWTSNGGGGFASSTRTTPTTRSSTSSRTFTTPTTNSETFSFDIQNTRTGTGIADQTGSVGGLTSNTAAAESSGKSGLSSGAVGGIAGGVVGAVILIGAALGVGIYLGRRKKAAAAQAAVARGPQGQQGPLMGQYPHAGGPGYPQEQAMNTGYPQDQSQYQQYAPPMSPVHPYVAQQTQQTHGYYEQPKPPGAQQQVYGGGIPTSYEQPRQPHTPGVPPHNQHYSELG